MPKCSFWKFGCLFMSIPKHCSNYDLVFNYELISELVCSTIDIINYCDYVGVEVKAENGGVKFFDKCILSTKDTTNAWRRGCNSWRMSHLGAFSTRYKTSDWTRAHLKVATIFVSLFKPWFDWHAVIDLLHKYWPWGSRTCLSINI